MHQSTVSRVCSLVWIGGIMVGIVTVLTLPAVAQSPGDMVLIPGGEFEMGDHHHPALIAGPVHAVYIDSLYIDAYEVTNQQYAAALNWAYGQGGLITVTGGVVYQAGSGTSNPYCSTTSAPSGHPHYGEYSRITWNGSAVGVMADKGDHPMVYVSWYGAAAYANWRSAQERLEPSYNLSTWECDFDANGYRLPTEAEWEKAARGGEHNPYYEYPWGDTIDGTMANYYESGDPYEGFRPDTTPVGYYDGSQTPQGSDMINGYGTYDMAGNVWEWCNDWFAMYYYASSPYDNPHGPISGTERVVRGGAWFLSFRLLKCANRGRTHPDRGAIGIGFRLVQPVESPDCNANGIPDECDLDCGPPGEECDVPSCGQADDCQPNDIPDECDIANGTSADEFPRRRADGVPDECQIRTPDSVKFRGRRSRTGR